MPSDQIFPGFAKIGKRTSKYSVEDKPWARTLPFNAFGQRTKALAKGEVYLSFYWACRASKGIGIVPKKGDYSYTLLHEIFAERFGLHHPYSLQINHPNRHDWEHQHETLQKAKDNFHSLFVIRRSSLILKAAVELPLIQTKGEDHGLFANNNYRRSLP